MNYKPNIHISGLSLKRKYKVVIITPSVTEESIGTAYHSGIQHALEEYENIRGSVWYTYNEFDVYSCREVYDRIVEIDADGVIIGLTFKEETLRLTRSAEERGSPISSWIQPWTTVHLSHFTSDHYMCGYLMAS